MKQKSFLIILLFGGLSPFFGCFEKMCSNYQYYDFDNAHIDVRNKIVPQNDSLVFQIQIDEIDYMGFNQLNSLLIPTLSAGVDCDKGRNGMKYPIKKIEITSSFDFNDNYPAGSLLNDLVTAYAWSEGSIYNYISLNDIDVSNGFQSRMHISLRPTLSQEQTLIVKLYKSNGEIVSFESETIHWE